MKQRMAARLAVALLFLSGAAHTDAITVPPSHLSCGFCTPPLVHGLVMEELGHGFTALLSMRSHAVEKPQCARLISSMSYGNNERRLTNAVNLLTPLGEQRRHASCVPIFGVLRRSAMWLVSTISSRLRSLKRDLHLHGLGNDTSDKTLQEAQDVTMVGLIKNIVLTIGKGVVGLTANSQALVADAAHSLSDIIADVVALLTLHVAHLPADKEHPYGHGKYEPIGALCISSLLISAGLGLAWNSVGLVQEMLYTSIIPVVPGKAALWLSIAAISLNEALFRSSCSSTFLFRLVVFFPPPPPPPPLPLISHYLLLLLLLLHLLLLLLFACPPPLLCTKPLRSPPAQHNLPTVPQLTHACHVHLHTQIDAQMHA